MDQKKPLVDLEELRARIQKLELGNPERNELIIARWLKYVEWWDSRSAQAKWKYFALRTCVVVCAAALPALVCLRELKPSSENNWALSTAAIIVSLIVAIAAGLEEVFHFGDIWREKRAAAELIKIEGFRFFEQIGPYRDREHKDSFPIFAAVVEDLIQHEIKDYIVAVTPRNIDGSDGRQGKRGEGNESTGPA